MKVILREADVKDVDTINQMFERLATQHQNLTGIPVLQNIKTMFGTPEDAEPTQYIKDIINNNKYKLWVLTDEDIEILGLVHFAIVRSELMPDATDIYIYYLISNYENHGVATRLLDIVKNVARKHKCLGVSLDVLTDNSKASTLYIKQGFQILRSDAIRKRMYCKL